MEACNTPALGLLNQNLNHNLPSMIRAMYIFQKNISQRSYRDELCEDKVPGQYNAACFFTYKEPHCSWGHPMCVGTSSVSTNGLCDIMTDAKMGGFPPRSSGKQTLRVKCIAGKRSFPDCQGKNCTMARIITGGPNILDILEDRICPSMTSGAPYNALREATISGYHKHRSITTHGLPLPLENSEADAQNCRIAQELMDSMHRQMAILLKAIREAMVGDEEKNGSSKRDLSIPEPSIPDAELQRCDYWQGGMEP